MAWNAIFVPFTSVIHGGECGLAFGPAPTTDTPAFRRGGWAVGQCHRAVVSA